MKSFVVIPISDSKICSDCGGKCCKGMPGAVFPEQLDPELRLETLKVKVLELLCTGNYSIDWWEGSPFTEDIYSDPTYYIRPSTVDMKGMWFDGSYGGTCFFLGEDGCSLPLENRPLGCLALIPKAEAKCSYPDDWPGTGDKQVAAKKWFEFNQLFLEIKESLR